MLISHFLINNYIVINFCLFVQSRFKKGGLFNLEEEELTHLGSSLSAFDDFGDNIKEFSDDDDDVDGNVVPSFLFYVI